MGVFKGRVDGGGGKNVGGMRVVAGLGVVRCCGGR